MCVKAMVADIQRASFNDGPGIRTTVFFKGCPLKCVWCHNPECISMRRQMLFYPEKCIGCGMCEKGCFSGARVVCGREMTAEEIFSEVLEDKINYGNDGGVTFSGGEPMIYGEMLKRLTHLCKKEKISTAIETSLYIFDAEVLKGIDFVMADFKIFDSKKHEKYTGVPNEQIKENIRKLDNLGVPFIIRTPIVPGINDSPTEISSIRDFLADLKNIKKYELLPYHPLGVPKQKALGLPETRFETPTRSEMEELNKYADIRRQN